MLCRGTWQVVHTGAEYAASSIQAGNFLPKVRCEGHYHRETVVRKMQKQLLQMQVMSVGPWTRVILWEEKHSHVTKALALVSMAQQLHYGYTCCTHLSLVSHRSTRGLPRPHPFPPCMESDDGS